MPIPVTHRSLDVLLDAAATVARSGAPLTVAAVAAAAGVAHGTVYRRWADRDAIMAALIATGRIAVEPPAEPDVRERLLDALGVLLRRKGLAGTTLEEVAREAGVGTVTVYRRFGDRRGLLRAFLAERTPRRLAVEFDGTGDPEANLLRLTCESLASLRDYGGLFQAAASADPEAVALFAEVRESSPSVRDLTARLIESFLPDPTGRTFQAYYGILLAVGAGSSGPIEEDARFVVSTFLHGVSR